MKGSNKRYTERERERGDRGRERERELLLTRTIGVPDDALMMVVPVLITEFLEMIRSRNMRKTEMNIVIDTLRRLFQMQWTNWPLSIHTLQHTECLQNL